MIRRREVVRYGHDAAHVLEKLRREAAAVVGDEFDWGSVVKHPRVDEGLYFATSAADTPFIGTVFVILENLSEITRRYSFLRAVRMKGPKISMHTDVCGSVAGNS